MSWPKFDAEHIIVSAQQMSLLEDDIIAHGLPVSALMEKVGHSIASWIFKNVENLEEGVVVLVGPGHNGGDGLVVARELYLSGIEVTIWCPFDNKKKLTEQHLSYCKFIGIKELDSSPDPSGEKLWIEALFGLGQTRLLPHSIAQLFKQREKERKGKLISIDVPAGISSDTGMPIEGCSAFASHTLTIGLVKQGLVQDVAMPYVGKIVRLDLGFPTTCLRKLPKTQARSIYSSDLRTINFPSSSTNANKYQRGRLLVVAGSSHYRGASLLALRGAIASGVGSINAALPEEVSSSMWQVAPEIVLSGSLKTSEDGCLEISEFLAEQDLNRFDSLLIGPGIGFGKEKWESIDSHLKEFSGLLVLDADALNRLAISNNPLRWLNQRQGPTWLTPHCSEFRRLFPDENHPSILKATQEASRKSGAVILHKGAHSIIADPFGYSFQLVETNPFSGRAGFGDLLAGLVSGVGAMALAVDEISSETIAIASLLHSESALLSANGSNAGSVVETLSKIVLDAQRKVFV